MRENYDIMSNKVVFDIMNENFFTSTAMLNAIWEHTKKDNIELMIPFVLYCVGKNTLIGQSVNIGNLIETLKTEFGYEEFFQNVVTNILNRLTPQTFKRQKDSFILTRSLEKEVDDVEKKRSKSKIEEDALLKKLTYYLNKYCTRKNETQDARKRLVQFFAKCGIIILNEFNSLNLISKKHDEIDYYIAQFIIEEQRTESKEYGFLINRVKGFFIANAIYLQPDNNDLYRSKFKNTDIYFDTTFLLNALGYKTEQSKDAAKELIEMLRSFGANLCCFNQNFKEIKGILRDYQNNLHPAQFQSKFRTLEHFDEHRYTIDDVGYKITTLETQLEKGLCIKIIDTPQYPQNRSEINSDSSLIDWEGLKNNIESSMTYNNTNALNNDVEFASAISRLRKRQKSGKIETCTALFVTTNPKLVRVVNSYFRFEDNEIPFFMTDLAISTLLWLKCYKSKPNYPELKLIENAYIALEPSHDLLEIFYDKIEKCEKEGTISADDAVSLRMERYTKKELMVQTKGDSSSLNYETVNVILKRLQSRYINEEQRRSEDKAAEYEKKKKEKAENQIQKAVKNATIIAEKAKKKHLRFLKCCVAIVGCIIFLIGIASIVYSFFSEAETYGKLLGSIPAAICLIIDCLGLADLLFTKKGPISSRIQKSVRRKYYDVYSEEMDKFKEILSA